MRPAVTALLCLAVLVATGGVATAAASDDVSLEGTSVNASGETLYVANNSSADYRTIQGAVDAAPAGATIVVAPGHYPESLTIDRNVTVEARAGAVLDGSGVPAGQTGIVVTQSSSPRVDGLRVEGFATGVAGIGAGAWTLSNVTITDTYSDAVYVPATLGAWTIRDSQITDSGRSGVFAAESTSAWTVRNTTVRNASAGVVATRASGDWRLKGVTIAGSDGDGVQAIETEGEWLIERSTLTANGDDGVDAARSETDWTIRSSTVTDNGGSGVLAEGATGNWSVRESVFRGNDAAAVTAAGTAGNWSVRYSQFRGDGRVVRGGGASSGDARRNWWGEGRVPVDRCLGGVRCDRALADPGAETVGDRDGDGLADTVERSIGTDPNATDTDGDGLPDGWEHRGYDADRDGSVEVPIDEYGADPRRKDVFVEIDSLTVGHSGSWVTTVTPSERYGPVVGPSLGYTGLPVPGHRSLEAMFAEAPVDNPDGTTGIDVHVDTGQFGGGEYLADPGIDPTANRSKVRAFRREFMADTRRPIFHYGLVVPNATDRGMAFAEDAAFAVAARVGGDPTTSGEFVSTLAHELGHSLGLLRNRGSAFGAVDTNNRTAMAYPSVMNYAAPPTYLDYADRCAFDEWRWLADTGLAPRTPIERPDAPRVVCLHTARAAESDAPILVSVTVDNPGTVAATRTLELRVDGDVTTNRTVVLGPGEHRQVTLLVDGLDPGSHTLAVGPFRQTVSVSRE